MRREKKKGELRKERKAKGSNKGTWNKGEKGKEGRTWRGRGSNCTLYLNPSNIWFCKLS